MSLQNDRYLTRSEVENLCGLSRSTIYRLMRQDQFPVPIKVGPRAVRWLSTEVEGYLKSRPRAEGEVR